MALTAGLDEHDHLIMGVIRDVPSINEDHLVALVEARHAQVGLKKERDRRTEKTSGDNENGEVKNAKIVSICEATLVLLLKENAVVVICGVVVDLLMFPEPLETR